MAQGNDANDSLATIPWKWRDWRASKARAVMTLEARAVYRELLDAQWGEADCALPSEDSHLAGLAGVDHETWLRVRAQVLAFFDQRSDGKWSNSRVLHEWKKAKKYRRAKREAGKKGGKAKAVKHVPPFPAPSTASVLPLTNPASPSPSPSPEERKERTSGVGRANPLIAGKRTDYELTALRLCREVAEITGEDPVEVMVQAARYEGAAPGRQKCNPANMSDDRLLLTISDLRATLKAEQDKRARVSA